MPVLLPVESGAQPVSVFTALLQSGLPDTETHIVRRGTSCFAIERLPVRVGPSDGVAVSRGRRPRSAQ